MCWRCGVSLKSHRPPATEAAAGRHGERPRQPPATATGHRRPRQQRRQQHRQQHRHRAAPSTRPSDRTAVNAVDTQSVAIPLGVQTIAPFRGSGSPTQAGVPHGIALPGVHPATPHGCPRCCPHGRGAGDCTPTGCRRSLEALSGVHHDTLPLGVPTVIAPLGVWGCWPHYRKPAVQSRIRVSTQITAAPCWPRSSPALGQRNRPLASKRPTAADWCCHREKSGRSEAKYPVSPRFRIEIGILTEATPEPPLIEPHLNPTSTTYSLTPTHSLHTEPPLTALLPAVLFRCCCC